MVHFNLKICTVDEFYQYGSKDDIIIIDEYDSIINTSPYLIFNQTINGVWQFKGMKVIACI